MSTPKEEYLMLREEILQLNTIINSTINFFYVFVSAVLLFAINQTDSLYVLLTYLIIFPAYAIALSKAIGTYRIGGYLYVFCEGSDFNWERRNKKLYDFPEFRTFKIISAFNLPFLFVSSFVTIIFLMKTDWGSINTLWECSKIVLAITFYIVQIALIIKYRRIGIEEYIKLWERIKKEESQK